MAASIVTDTRFRDHDPGSFHPESPARLEAIDSAIASLTDLEVEKIAPRAASRDEVLRAHGMDHVERLEHARGRTVSLDADTATSDASVETAYLAAGATIEICAKIARKEIEPGIALVRPPGHHATRARSMGFCLINNIAVAAHAVLAEGLAERVAIYDWDVHHGNGTEDIFYEDDRVLYMSTHQWPFYPGTGRHTDIGRGKGEGTTLNVPLPAGTDDDALIKVSKDVLMPRVRDFCPDLILISAGFDPFIDDPIGGFRITVDGFRALAGHWRSLAEETSGGRIAAVLEGGYHLEGLGRCVSCLIDEWNT